MIFLGTTLLKEAAIEGALSTVKLLLQRGARTDLEYPLHMWPCQHIRLGTNLKSQHIGIGNSLTSLKLSKPRMPTSGVSIMSPHLLIHGHGKKAIPSIFQFKWFTGYTYSSQSTVY